MKKRKTSSVDTEILEETAIAIAQAEICAVMRMTSTPKGEVAKRLGMSSPSVTRALKGDHNLTIRTMARLFGACGYEVRFVAVPIGAKQ
jgi:DNA-binding phage protein